MLVFITALAAWQLRDGLLSQADGVLLLGGMVLVLGMQIVLSLREGSDEHKDDAIAKNSIIKDSITKNAVRDDAVIDSHEPSLTQGIGSLFIGMFILVLSSQAIVWGAIVSIGTSLPELVASLAAARRGEHDMALGNIIGSNIFNTLGVVGLAAIIAPITANPVILSRDILMMGILTLLLFALCIFAFVNKRPFGRASGVTLVLCFFGYTLWLIQTVNM